MKVWLDDVRPAPEGWVWCKTPAEVIELLKAGGVELVSLDHDVNVFAAEREFTGMDVLLWVEEQVATQGLVPPEIRVHSANSPAHARMLKAVEAILRLDEENRRSNVLPED